MAHSILVNLSIVGVLMTVVFGFSQALVFFKTGAAKETMLLLTSKHIKTVYQPKVFWLDEQLAEGREFEKATKTKVLEDYFTDKAREALLEVNQYYEQNDQSVSGTTISHEVRPRFYAEDGTLVVLSDQVISYNKLTENGVSLSYYDTARYQVMLLLEDNYWRIRHKVKSEKKPRITEEKEEESNTYKISGNRFLAAGQPFSLKCINYYPSENPWMDMWENFDSAVIKKDLERIKKMDFNAIRIFVPFEQFGKGQVVESRLEQLNELLSITDSLDIKVIVTLFDFFLDYQVEKWTVSDRHAEQLIKSVMVHPSLFAWDVKNEPDLDFDSFGKEEVEAWLYFMIRRIKAYDPIHFVTVGWSQPEVSQDLLSEVDFTSFHFYREPGELSDYLANSTPTGKPVFLGETGMHSYESWWFPFSKSEEEQSQYVSDVLKIVTENQLNYGLWTLYDFKRVPSNVAGKAPWKKLPQKRYGMIDHKGREKKIYNIIVNYNSNGK